MEEDVILNEIKHIKKGVNEIKEHLKTQNGTIADNTKFRIEGRTYIKLIGGAVGTLVVPVVILLIKEFLIK